MIKMTRTTNVRKKNISNDIFHIILIIGITFMLYFGMEEFINDDFIIPQLNIYLSTKFCTIISLFFFWASLSVSYYVNKLKKAEDWVLGIITPIFVLSAIKLIQYREIFLFAVIILSIMLIITLYGIKTIISHNRKGIKKYIIEKNFRFVSVYIVILGIIAAVPLIITHTT